MGAGLPALTRRTPLGRRGETASAFFVVLYVMLALPVVGVGVLIQLTSLRAGGLIFAAVMGALLLLLLTAQLRHRGD